MGVPPFLPMKNLLLLLILLLPAPVAAQLVPPEGAKVMKTLVDEGYFERCAAGSRRGCSLFARLLAHQLNPTASPSGWGWLSKNPGETQHDGFAEDAIVYGNNSTNFRNVIDLVVGAGAPGARANWPSTFIERRNGNNWVAPRQLDAADLDYLKPGGTPTPPPPPPPPDNEVVDLLNQVLRRLSLIDMQVAEAFKASVEAKEAALTAAQNATAAHEAVEALAARPLVIDWPEYRGRVLGFGVTLRPQVP